MAQVKSEEEVIAGLLTYAFNLLPRATKSEAFAKVVADCDCALTSSKLTELAELLNRVANAFCDYEDEQVKVALLSTTYNEWMLSHK